MATYQYEDDTDYEDNDLFDPAKTSDEEFLAAMQAKYHPQEAAPAAPAPQPIPQATGLPTPPTSAGRQLAELRGQVSNLDQQIQIAGGPAVELRAQRLAVTEQVERLSDAVAFGFDGQPTEALTEMAEDAVLKIDELQKTINALPAESVRSEADRVRLARAERERNALISKEVALRKETALRRDLEAFGRVRVQGIDARARKAIEAERAQALNDRLAKARSEPDFQPWMVPSIVHEMNAAPVTADDLERKRVEIQKAFDNEIADGIRKDRIRRVGGDPDPRWSGFDVAR